MTFPARAESLRVVSYGGGVQSTALLVLAARRIIDFSVFLMANVGDDSEDPRTLNYVRSVAMPYAERHGIEMHLLDRLKRDGTSETLWGRLMDDRTCPECKGYPATLSNMTEATPGCTRCGGTGRAQSRSLPIPVRMSNGAPGTRSCTADFKIAVTGKWVKAHGATKDNPATIAIGISRDEIMRANNRRHEPHERIVYPLIGIGEETGILMSRQDCIELIRFEGLPVPGKSSCFFCPLHRPAAWVDMRRERPDLFDRSVRLERALNERRAYLGKDPVWLTRFGKPLDDAIGEPDDLLPGFDPAEGECDSGWCFT